MKKLSKYFKNGDFHYQRSFHKILVNQVETCLYCGAKLKVCKPKNPKSKQKKRINLVVHHINGNKWDYEPSNLTILCEKCHRHVGHIGPKKIANYRHRFLNFDDDIKNLTPIDLRLLKEFNIQPLPNIPEDLEFDMFPEDYYSLENYDMFWTYYD